MHFLMDNAKILVVFGGLPALFVVTNVYFLSLGFVLSKIKTFCWEHLSTDGNLEIFVRNYAVAVDIEFVKDVVKLFLSDFQTPEIKIKLEFSSTNFSSFFDIEIHKSFSQSFPLKHDFF